MPGEDACVVGIDIGTSGVRAVAVSRAGMFRAGGAALFAELGSDRRDPAAWRTALQRALQRLAEDAPALEIAAIAVDGTSGTVLPVAADGAPMAKPLMYNDAVDDPAILAAVAAQAPHESAAHGATSGLAKALRYQRLVGVAHIIHQADWLLGLLGGRFDLSDENNALKTGYDPVARRWPDWIAATGMQVNLLPEVRPAGTPVARVTARAAAEFGLPQGALLAAGTTDGCASFLATGASEPGDGVTALGSTLTVKLLSHVPLFAPEYGLYSHRVGDDWLAGGASNSGGTVLAQFFSPVQLERLSQQIDPETDTGLDYYPLPRPGERFPVNDPDLSPRLSPRPDDDAGFLHGLLEGIAGIEALAYQRLAELGGPRLGSIRTVGGGARNPVWQRIRERRLGVPARPVQSTEAAAGVARLALRALEMEKAG